MKKALAIITYARFDYFELVLPSILAQKVKGRSVSEFYDIYIFQDGLFDGDSESNQKGHCAIKKLIESLPSDIQIIRQNDNLAVALHFDFIERLLFVEKAYDFVVFCEDDLILAPGYMNTIDMMNDKFHDDQRVGIISAYPNNPTVTLEQQRANQKKFAKMGHHWAFGLTREFWQKRQPLIDYYLEFVRGVPYRKRPTPEILNWLNLIGFRGDASSQDYIKKCATLALGACRLSSYVNYGLPIGRTGLHFKPEQFKQIGLDRTIVFDVGLESIGDLDDEQYTLFFKNDALEIGDKFAKDICLDINGWQSRLKGGEFDPKRLMPEFFAEKQPSSSIINWKSSDIPIRPHMEKEGIILLEERLLKAEVYLEYGAGGSTVLAADLGVKEIHSIDSDRGFLDAVQSKVAERQSTAKMTTHYVDIGPTREWGQPTYRVFAHLWPRYCITAWDILISQDHRPDLILIDGRFRIACFMASLVFAKPGTIILFDDYFDRSIYHVVEKHLQPSARAGRMAEFIVDSSFSVSKVLLDLMVTSTDPN